MGSSPAHHTTRPSLTGKQRIQPVRVGQGRKKLLDKSVKLCYNKTIRKESESDDLGLGVAPAKADVIKVILYNGRR